MANKLGKTAVSANIAISWCLGYEPWTRMPEGQGIGINGKWYRESSLGHMPPIRMRITGEDWTHSIGETIVPELKKWAPEGLYKTRKNSQGVEYKWDWFNGSTIEIMTHDQDIKLFESWIGHAWWADEPPPYPIWAAMSRGLFTHRGKVLIPTTPLREAWILDELVLSARPDVAVVDGTNLWDNPLLYDYDMKVLMDLGLTEHKAAEFFNITIEKSRAEAKKYLKQELMAAKKDPMDAEVALEEAYSTMKIDRFDADTPEDERRTRLFGEFKALVGRVLKNYAPDIHDIEPFEIPTDWPVTVLIDFHLSKPHAVSFFAIDKQGRHYQIDELWQNCDIETIADEIIRRKKKKSWRISMASIDPLSKGDTQYLKNRYGNVEDSFTKLRNKLAPYDIIVEVGSKDKTSGIRNINSWLKGVNGLPIFYMFNTCEQSRHQYLRWVYEDDKPKKEQDDFGENLYRYTLMNVIYTEPEMGMRLIKEPELGVV